MELTESKLIDTETEMVIAYRKPAYWHFLVRDPLALLALCWLIYLLLAGFFGPILLGDAAVKLDLRLRNTPPGSIETCRGRMSVICVSTPAAIVTCGLSVRNDPLHVHFSSLASVIESSTLARSYVPVIASAEPSEKVRLCAWVSDSSVTFVVRPWVNAADYWDVYFDLTETLKVTLEANGITIPYPQQDLYLQTPVSLDKAKA